jgi:protein-S-isoprenylcysteine O-methyltransferase Ste14
LEVAVLVNPNARASEASLSSPRKPGLSTTMASCLDALERLTIVLLYVWLVWRVVASFDGNGQLISVFLLASEGLVLVFTLIRRRSLEITTRPVDWMLAFAATVAPFLVQPSPGHALVAPGVALSMMIFGMLLQIHAKVALGRSFGCVAANRGLKFSGPYRFVRHPMYAGYLLSHLAFLAMNPSPWNATLYLLAYVLQVPRLLAEERLLGRDADYARYRQAVRYRLIPGLF